MNNPALYSTVNSLQRNANREFIDEFIDEISEMSGRCLDIGSGPGDSTVDLLLPKINAKANLVCSDISEKMVNFAKEKYEDNRRLSFLKLNIQTPELPVDLIEQFDHVTSSFCVNWCHDTRQVFENIFNLLRPGGTALILFTAKSSHFNAYRVIADIPQYQPYMKDVDGRIPVFQNSESPRNILKALIKDVGFEVRHCSLRQKMHIFDSPDILGKFLRAVNPFIQRMPADLGEKYLKDLVKEVAKQSFIIDKNNENEDDYKFMLAIDPFMRRMPTDLAEKYLKDLVKEVMKHNFVGNKNNGKEDDYSVLFTYSLFFIRLRKPSAN